MATGGVRDVGHADLIRAVNASNDVTAIVDSCERAVVERVLHFNSTSRQIMIQVKGLTLIQFDGNQVYIVGIVVGHRPKIAADHQ
ncbi:hypothetical protein D3C81_1652780 [compost metagenome]